MAAGPSRDTRHTVLSCQGTQPLAGEKQPGQLKPCLAPPPTGRGPAELLPTFQAKYLRDTEEILQVNTVYKCYH